MRFFAALLVVMAHLSGHYIKMSGSTGVLGTFINFGPAGVDIFFVISGYIMWYTTENKKGISDATVFIVKRMSRIFAGYWPFFFLALLFSYYYMPGKLSQSDLLSSFFLIPQSLKYNLMPLSWTLSYELYFYLIVGILLLFFRTQARQILVIVALMVFFIGIYNQQIYTNGQLSNFSVSKFLVSPYILEFLSGCLAWELVNRKVFSSYGYAVALGVITLAFGAWFNASILDNTIFYGYHKLIRVSIFGVAAFFLVYGLAGLESQGKRLSSTLILTLGGASYALYLSHHIFILIFAKTLSPYLSNIGHFQATLVYILFLALVIGYSVLHY